MPPMAEEGQLRWGVIGTGAIARAWSDDLRRTDSGRIVAVGSRTQAAADRFGDDFDVPARYASYEALVADADVDVVYVTTPHPWHHDNAILALEAGKPVLCEKPFTMNAAEAREMVAVARERKLFLMEAMWTRFLPHVVELRRLLAEGAIGEIIRVSADHGQWIPHDPAHRIFAPELGGGALLDLGVYPGVVRVDGARHPGAHPQHDRAGVHRRRRADLDALRLRGRRSGAADVHVARAQPDARRHRRHRGADRDRHRFLPPELVHADHPHRRARRASRRRTRAGVCATRPTRSRAACARDCSRARSCRSTSRSRSWRRWTPSSPAPSPAERPAILGRARGFLR